MHKVQVLIVEDEAIVSMGLRFQLEAMGYSVPPEISSGEEAVDVACRLRPDLLLMDIGLSGKIDGVHAAALIRGQVNVPVVFLTAYADEATLERVKLTEPYGFLGKPVDSWKLRTVVEDAIHKHQNEGTPR